MNAKKTRSLNVPERRANTRHQVSDDSAILLSPDGIISFSVIDISSSGLAFSYNEKGLETPISEKATIHFFGDKIGAPDIRVVVVSDIETAATGMDTSAAQNIGTPNLRRCAVKFDGLSYYQKSAINNYIKGLCPA